LGTYGHDRARGLEVFAQDARAGHRDLIERGVLVLRVCGGAEAGGRRRGRDGGDSRADGCRPGSRMTGIHVINPPYEKMLRAGSYARHPADACAQRPDTDQKWKISGAAWKPRAQSPRPLKPPGLFRSFWT